MTSFLQYAAQSAVRRYGSDIKNVTFVFPSKRAEEYFARYVSQESPDTPRPVATDLDSIFSAVSGLQLAGRYDQMAILYKVYCKCRNSEESFDNFYGWGDVILNDFDSIDKYMANAERLFSNLKNRRILSEDFSFLQPQQVELIRTFWESFSVDDNAAQSRFIEFWSLLGRVYEQFSRELLERGIAYQGLMQRKAASVIQSKGYDFGLQKFAFVGLNALNSCEKILLSQLYDEKRADFYWDYDAYYVNDASQSGGMFMRYNLNRFPPPENLDIFDNFTKEKDIQIITAPSDAIQVKLLPQALEQIRGTQQLSELDSDTAIILCDEGLLVPLLYSLPIQDKNSQESDGISSFNVTLGYPVRQTPVYGLLEALSHLHGNIRTVEGVEVFYRKDMEAVLQHQYVQMLGAQDLENVRIAVNNSRTYVHPSMLDALPDALRCLFITPHNSLDYCDTLRQFFECVSENISQAGGDSRILHCEYIVCVCAEMCRLCEALRRSALEMTLPALLRLLCSAVKSMKIPFEGNPIEGLQVMGMLETHAIDFKNIIVLSLNEEILSYRNSVSFIPYGIRRAYGLPSAEEYDALYGYYFYRLLQRAQRVRLLYNGQSEGVRSGEMSRYLRQLIMESPHAPPVSTVTYNIGITTEQPIAAPKNDEVQRLLERFTDGGDRSLSTTAVQKYIACPLQFYFAEIVGAKPSADEIHDVDGRMLGDIFHHAIRDIYEPLCNKEITPDILRNIIANGNTLLEDTIEKHITAVCNDTVFAAANSNASAGGLNSSGKMELAQRAIYRYAKDVILYDIHRLEQSPFKVQSLETPVAGIIETPVGEKLYRVRFKGIIDRIDVSSHGVSIIDYKTGRYDASMQSSPSLDVLFDPVGRRRGEMFQILCYSWMYSLSAGGVAIEPALYFLRNLCRAECDCSVSIGKETVSDADILLPAFYKALQTLLTGMFDPLQPFTQTADHTVCSRCVYAAVCRR